MSDEAIFEYPLSAIKLKNEEIEKLRAENKRLQDQIIYTIDAIREDMNENAAKITKLTRQNEIMKKALEFYGDITKWSKCGACSRLCSDSDFIQTIPNQTTQPIGGKKALQECEGVE